MIPKSTPKPTQLHPSDLDPTLPVLLKDTEKKKDVDEEKSDIDKI